MGHLQRLRIGVIGKLFGVLKINWCLVAVNATTTEQPACIWLIDKTHGTPVNCGPLRGVLTCTLRES